jgi:prevent-host-death family protein
MIAMPNIKPVSDLRNYTEVLNEVTENNPVYLTRNGRGEYAILTIKELDKLKATIRLLAKLEEGEKSAREKGWISADDVEAILGI